MNRFQIRVLYSWVEGKLDSNTFKICNLSAKTTLNVGCCIILFYVWYMVYGKVDQDSIHIFVYENGFPQFTILSVSLFLVQRITNNHLHASKITSRQIKQKRSKLHLNMPNSVVAQSFVCSFVRFTIHFGSFKQFLSSYQGSKYLLLHFE